MKRNSGKILVIFFHPKGNFAQWLMSLISGYSLILGYIPAPLLSLDNKLFQHRITNGFFSDVTVKRPFDDLFLLAYQRNAPLLFSFPQV